MNSTETPPFDNQLGAPDPVYDDILAEAEKNATGCGHPRRYRYQRSNGCLVCDVVALLDTERPEEFQKGVRP